MDDLTQKLLTASTWVLPVMLAIILHEIAHGWAALCFGDNTAKSRGRLTLNPVAHIDRTGTILLPGLLMLMQAPIVFGYAKPVPVDFDRLRPLRLGTVCVALAGPFTNFLLAIIAGCLLHLDIWLPEEQNPWIFANINNMLMINAVLMVFNLIPVPPLDGGRVLTALLTKNLQIWFAKWDRWGMVFILLFLFLPSFFGYNVAASVIGVPVFWVLEQVLWITGNAK